MALTTINGNYQNAIKPIYVDIVLSYAMIDTLKSQLRDLENLDIVFKIVASFGVDSIFDMLPVPFNLFKFAKVIYEIIFGIREAERPELIDEDHIKNRKDALLYMISRHQQKIEEFEKKFPQG
jgi:hypothetical protein